MSCRRLCRFRHAALEGASRSVDPEEQVPLAVPGTDTAHIALIYKDLIGQAVEAGDFSHILARDCTFSM